MTSTGSAAGRIHALKCDVTDEADVKAAFAWIRAQYGTVHVLVNNAGMMSSGFLTGEWVYGGSWNTPSST